MKENNNKELSFAKNLSMSLEVHYINIMSIMLLKVLRNINKC